MQTLTRHLGDNPTYAGWLEIGEKGYGFVFENAGKPVLYFENIEGGHGGAADNRQRAHNQALGWAFLWRELGK